ncbi:hypothetical protein [Cellulomonas terrae]|uniref:Uncharacterized protein n=1 Tax=Cellulomonas terrae TaxID=311234 RepID=A0A511JQI9_9CELL|nr:hypothetical protein [Cellulomonas terrae]GEM00200.1 hypothetical protein CTE05_37460 [Cellulomonas terrae]
MTHGDQDVPDESDAGSSMPVAPQYRSEPVAAASAERPSSVTRAVQLMYVGAALSVVGIVVTWATTSQLRDQIAAASPTLSSDDVDSALTISLTSATVVGLVAVGLWLWMAAANGAGRPWARVVASVLGGLGVLSAVFSLMTATGITVATQLLSLALAVAILVLLWRPASSEYYRARSAQ